MEVAVVFTVFSLALEEVLATLALFCNSLQALLFIVLVNVIFNSATENFNGSGIIVEI